MEIPNLENDISWIFARENKLPSDYSHVYIPSGWAKEVSLEDLAIDCGIDSNGHSVPIIKYPLDED
jgi:hypothetical protein